METIINELMSNFIEIIVLVLVSLITLAVNKAVKVINEMFSLEVTEFEVYQVARNIHDLYNDSELDELFEHVLESVEERLKKKGIKIDQEEVIEIIDNVLKDLKSEWQVKEILDFSKQMIAQKFIFEGKWVYKDGELRDTRTDARD